MKKMVAVLGVCLFACSFSGCKGKQNDLKLSEIKQETLFIRSDKSVQLGANEKFDKVYYKKSDLKKFVKEQIEAYNEQEGEDSVKLSEFKVKNEKATAIFTYHTIEDYCMMNDVEAFLYTMKEAKEQELLPEYFIDSSDGTKVKLEKVVANETYHVLVIKEEINIKVSDTIQYYANAMLTSADSVQTKGNGNSVIVYK